MTEISVPVAEPSPLSPEQQAAQATEAQAQATEQTTEEFTQEELLAAAKALREQKQKPTEEAPTEEKQDDQQVDPIFAPKDDEARATEREVYGEALAGVFDKAGINAANLCKQFYDTGKISEDAYSKLGEQGYTREVVDAYLAGAKLTTESKQAIAANDIKSIKDSVGGDAEYQRMAQWAVANLPPHEVESFDKLVNTGSPDAIRWAVQGLNAKYRQAVGHEPQLIGSGKAPGAGDVFSSTYEVVQAMSDPRYKKDREYVRQVQEKLARSDVFAGR